MNETIQAILARRSVRSYSDRPVEDDLLTKLLDCALHAPSGGNH